MKGDGPKMFVAKPIKVEAMQFSGVNFREIRDWIRAARIEWNVDLVWPSRPHAYLELWKAGVADTVQVAIIGDWLTWDHSRLGIVPGGVFHDHYVEVSE